MNIIKASIQNAVRRKWKFALVVFLCGVGLVVLTNVYDVAGAQDRIDAVNEEMRSGDGPPSDEQFGAMASSAGMLALFSMLSFFFMFGTIMFAFMMPGGMVANERRSATIMLWAQHPMPLSSFYLQRYLGIQVATLAALLIFGLTTTAAVFPSQAGPPTGVGGVVSICLLGMLACAVSFGITAHGIRRAALFGLVYFLPSNLTSDLLTVSEASTSTVAELARAILPFVVFPGGAIDDLAGGFESGVAWDWGATGMVVYHFALWTGIAWLGLRRLEGRPLKL